ncbi:MAG: hypothetical protein ACI4MI_05800 [Christensenellales bacterium]
MSTITIKIKAQKKYALQVRADGKVVKGKKDKSGFSVYTFDSNDTQSIVEICNVNELSSPLWWLWSIFYFIISLLGIFDPGYGNNYFDVRCKFAVDCTHDGIVEVRVGMSDNGVRRNVWRSDSRVREIENEFCKNEKIAKRIKLNKILKVVLWVAIVAIAIVATIVNVIK